MPSKYSLAAGVLHASTVLGTSQLIASHFTANLYSLTLSDSNQLSISSETRSGNFWPAWLDFDSESNTLYVADEANWRPPNGLTTFTVHADGSLSQNSDGQAVTGGAEVHSTLYGGDDGRAFLALAHYGSSKISTFQLPLTSSSRPLQEFPYRLSQPKPNPRQEAPHPHSVVEDPTGNFLFSGDLGADLIRIYAIDPSTGLLTECPAAATSEGDGPRHLLFHEECSTTVFVLNEISNSVGVWSINYSAACPSLTLTQTISTLPDNVQPPEGAKAAAIVQRDGFLYVSNRRDRSFGDQEDSLATFEIGTSEDGDVELSFVDITSAHSFFPRTLQINAAGDLVAVGGQTSANVAIIERNVTTGRLGDLVASVRVGRAGTLDQEDGLSAVIWVE
ncbi:putative isomerase YbhE [Sodiomyces alkalinus F11]|uniref:Putative isomerase YbhE n=1 Tax=Sodiomyces alkalinus (strain CBS 110278 / VKM F-3762 / F11) TaxID=1314773 RepID=A0A3N2QAH7_SODAK|nr:putative isomerase YbhE [Sodiomyces alkalinus F11]ROT43665.1 putative isomerase YbhE [Sodiomyces alkalinus F11]